MYRFLFSRRWMGYFVLAIVFAIACVLLGRWQMDRRAETQANINKIVTNYNSAPVAFSAAKPLFEHMDTAREWSQVKLHGTYLPQDQLIVRNRTLNGQPGYQVLVPFRVDSGDTVIVDRGFLPIGNKENGRPDSIPDAPSGEVTVVVRLRPSEPALDRGAPSGQIASIDLNQYASQVKYPLLTGAYGRMASESPAPAVAPMQLPMPATDEGTHLSYSLQWFAFGVLMILGFGYAARQQAKNDALDAEDAELARAAAAAGGTPDDGGQGTGGPGAESAAGAGAVPPSSHTAAKYWRQNRKKAERKTAERRAAGRRSAEDEEDAILDAQGFK
ncbi:SURF1 family cytochrome oxidase biogenesis protein [Arthrobacter woluwensis]|uniref:SURF1 family cytochrome oxidase biogenesis protein n=1 Tax=Arthrobacter woluwensis TaxID=156980 RepID=UPI0038070E2C